MNIQEITKQVIMNNNGIIKAADLISSGISRAQIRKLCNIDFIERICHGYYKLTKQYDFLEEQIITKTIPKAIVSLESALYHYGYSDFSPRKWSITVPRNISRKMLGSSVVPIKIHYVQDDLYELGKTTYISNGIPILIYDRERTICDCFKYRSKIDSEIFNKAVNAYAQDNKKNLSNLSLYSKKLRVYKKVMQLMEVLING